MEWISCKDRLPDKNGSYFVTFTWGEIVRCTDKMNFYLSDHSYRWIWDNHGHRNMTNNVKAWMPAEPYMGN